MKKDLFRGFEDSVGKIFISKRETSFKCEIFIFIFILETIQLIVLPFGFLQTPN